MADFLVGGWFCYRAAFVSAARPTNQRLVRFDPSAQLRLVRRVGVRRLSCVNVGDLASHGASHLLANDASSGIATTSVRRIDGETIEAL
jgi:hypothetical protein